MVGRHARSAIVAVKRPVLDATSTTEKRILLVHRNKLKHLTGTHAQVPDIQKQYPRELNMKIQSNLTAQRSLISGPTVICDNSCDDDINSDKCITY